MSQAIKCDKCGKYDDSCSGKSRLRASDVNFGDSFKENIFPVYVDLCESCTRELLNLIRNWCKKK